PPKPADFLAGGRLPQPNGRVLAGRGHRPTVWGDDNRRDRAGVAVELVDRLARGHVPKVKRAPPRGGYRLAVRGKGQLPDHAVGRELPEWLARGHVPQLNSAALGPHDRGHGPAVGRKGYPPDPVAARLQLPEFLPRTQIPEPNFLLRAAGRQG